MASTAREPLTPCTKKGYWSQVAQVRRLWKAGAARIFLLKGQLAGLELSLAVRGTLTAIQGPVPALLYPKDLLPAVGWSSDPHPASPPCWALGGFSATLGYRSLGPLSSSQKSQGHIGCGTWGLVGTVTFSGPELWYRWDPWCTPFLLLPKVEQELGRQGCRSYFWSRESTPGFDIPIIIWHP